MPPRLHRTDLARILVIAALLAAVAVSVIAMVQPTDAHDSGPGAWINHGSFRSPSGEWCCGAGDCEVVTARPVTSPALGFTVTTANGPEFVPQAESTPSADEHFWRCHRPDGTRRCFFAPPGATW